MLHFDRAIQFCQEGLPKFRRLRARGKTIPWKKGRGKHGGKDMEFNQEIKERVRALLLDVDGTLFSSEGIIHEVYADAFQRFKEERGKPERCPSREQIMAEIGKPVKVIFQNLTPELESADQDALSESILRDLVRRIDAGEGEHYPGVRETLQALRDKGMLIFAASNGRLPYIEAILRAGNYSSLFTDVPSINYRDIRDKNELVAHTLTKNGLAPEQALVVGDRASDRDAALSNGCYFAACLYGHGNPAEHEGAHLFLENFPGLAEIFSA